MKKNIGQTDQIIRIALAFIFSALFITGKVSGTLGMTLLIVGGFFLFTSVLSFCPIYSLFKISTCPTPRSK